MALAQIRLSVGPVLPSPALVAFFKGRFFVAPPSISIPGRFQDQERVQTEQVKMYSNRKNKGGNLDEEGIRISKSFPGISCFVKSYPHESWGFSEAILVRVVRNIAMVVNTYNSGPA